MKPEDTFNRWRVVAVSLVGKQKALCECLCGVRKWVDAYTLRNGLSKSCGCHRTELQTKGNRDTRAYSSWLNMKARCLNTNAPYYKYYGARGISICKRWLSFENFFSDMGEAPITMTLERNDVNKGYFPRNCRWATRQEQQDNRRSNHNITFKGQTKCIAAWARELEINTQTLRNRIRRGWPIKIALSKQLRTGERIEKTASSF